MFTEIKGPTLPGLKLLKPELHIDHRGYFIERYHQEQLSGLAITTHFVQDNFSLSKEGTLRGLHYQCAPYAQAKLVYVPKGSIWDVALDLRSGPTFGHWQGFILDDQNHHQLFIPRGFAHGFLAMSSEALVAYKCDAYHSPSQERGIHFQDPTLKIPWSNYMEPKIVSQKDQAWPLFKDANIQQDMQKLAY